VSCVAFVRQLNCVSYREQLSAIEDRHSEMRDQVTSLHAELLEFDSATMLKLTAERLEDNLLDLKVRLKKCKATLKTSSSFYTDVKDESVFEVKPATTEPKSAGPWFEPQMDRNQVDHLSRDDVRMVRTKLDFPNRERESCGSRLSSTNPFIPQFMPPPPLPIPMDSWNGRRMWTTYDQQSAPPGPKLVINNFDGDVMKYFEFKRKFKRHVENVYFNSEDRMSFLESMCVGKAKDVIAGLSCLPDQNVAYEKAWIRLEKRFGDSQKLMAKLQEQVRN